MVLGSIGYGGYTRLKELIDFLAQNNFEVINQLGKEGLDYSKIEDFRHKQSLSEKIVKTDLQLVHQADLIVWFINGPSFGAAFEVAEARRLNKEVILFAPEKVPTPWPFAWASSYCYSKKELLEKLSGF